MPKIDIARVDFLVASIIFLFAGFLGQSIQWRQILSVFNSSITFKEGIISTGLPIFGKYIPGKVWTILGRAMYISQSTKLNVKEVSWISLQGQFFMLLIGFFLSSLFLIFMEKINTYAILILVSLGFLFILIHTDLFAKAINWTLRLFKKSKFNVRPLTFVESIRLAPAYSLTWISWSIGFWFLVSSITGETSSFYVLSVFPLAASLGIMAIIVPGGLGVREGIMVGLMTMMNFDLDTAVLVSLMQRLWFLVGETFLFLLGLALNGWKINIVENS